MEQAEKARFEQAKKDLQQLPHGSITTNSSGSIRQQQPGLSEEEWQHRAQRLAQVSGGRAACSSTRP